MATRNKSFSEMNLAHLRNTLKCENTDHQIVNKDKPSQY